MMPAAYGSLPFDAQIAFFRRKLAMPSRSWTDIVHEHHDHAFVVAGAMRMALVEDLQAAVQKAISEGTTLQQFRKGFNRIVRDHGWRYRGSRGWRTRVIYETNLRTSYQAGRYTQLQKMDFWQYHHSPSSSDPRPQHLAWSGMILPKDDPFWRTNYPPNGFGCKCTVTGMSRKTLERKGLKVSPSPKLKMRRVKIGTRGPNPRTVTVPEGVGPGFAYPPGRDAWMHTHALPPLDPSRGFPAGPRIPDFPARDLLPSPRKFSANKLLPTFRRGKEEEYARAFLAEFGADIGKPAVFVDATGEPVVISDAMFRDVRGRWKIAKHGRERYLPMLAAALKDPDEIWVAMEWHHALGKAVIRRRYVAWFELPDGSRPGFAVFEYGRDGWLGVTTFPRNLPADELDGEVEKVRRGIRLYKRKP
ncbi:MAG: hypothetical protein D6717_01680 [Gammaproteobacteria bacterium]|nr:MAG: hypothetical protein D6717_01680 [Gammaproteobacteria bacterium]